jgi:glycosyltransferase involved in cell wall biosynthesis
MTNPLVSICIPTFNGARFLQEALDSISAQTYRHIEVVISDDASVDNTLALVEQFNEFTNVPVQIIAHTPSGIGANWNNSMRHARGDFIKFLFQDDVLNPSCIEQMIEVFMAHPEVGLVGCKREFILEGAPGPEIGEWIEKYKNLQIQFEKDEALTRIDHTLFARRDFLDSPMNKIGEPPTVMFKKAILDEVGYFEEHLEQILDYVFYYRILKIKPIFIINQPLVKFRIHEAQATNLNRNRPIKDYALYNKILYKEFYPLLHPSHKKKLALKFSFKAKLKNKVKGVLRKLRS